MTGLPERGGAAAREAGLSREFCITAASHYPILGVSSKAAPDQIKRAYRRKLIELRPDHYGEDVRPSLAVREPAACWITATSAL